MPNLSRSRVIGSLLWKRPKPGVSLRRYATFMRLFLTIAALAFCTSAMAQKNPAALTSADYARAEMFMGYNTTPLVLGAAGRPGWMADGRFWYRVLRDNGPEFVIVDPSNGGARAPAFDRLRLASALSEASGAKVQGNKLPFQSIDVSDDHKTVSFSSTGKRWKCTLDNYHCAADTGAPPNSALSPDKKEAAFIRDYNLWVRDIATGAETRLTTDGVKDFGYATDNAGWVAERPSHPSVVARFQKDRNVSAGPAGCRRNVPGEHHRWTSRSWRPGNILSPATMS